jgi:hypothetical protein
MDVYRLSKGELIAKACRTVMFGFAGLGIVASIAISVPTGDYRVLLPGFVGVMAFLLVAYLAETIRGHVARLARAF